MSSSTTSNVLTTPSSTLSSNSKSITLTSKQIAIVIGLVSLGLLILLSPIFVIAIRRLRHRKYEQPEEESKCVDAAESQETFASKPSRHSLFKHAEADPFITAKTEYFQNPYSPLVTSSVKDYHAGLATHEAHVVSLHIAQSPKDDEGFETVALHSDPPPTSSVKTYYGGLATHEAHVVSLDIAQSPKDKIGFETVALHSDRPSFSSKIKLAPLIIPENIPKDSNGDRSAKGTVSRKPSDSGFSDDSASLYSMPSESASTYLSRSSSLETIRPPPLPPIPAHFASPTLSTMSRGSDVTVTAPRPYDEESINRLPPLPSFPRLSLHEDIEEEDETQIYNVAKLLQSRQAKLPKGRKESISRNTSIVSHIERSGSISVVISPTDEGSYRPRYNRLKQKRSTMVPFSSNLSAHVPNSLSTLSTPNPLAPRMGS